MDHQQTILLFLQLGLLLALARLLGEAMKRMKQPAVIGELLAGIVLGPSLLGWAAPGVSDVILPESGVWRIPLDVVSGFGLLMLMLLTGLETDVRLLRSLGRPAFMASAFGLLVPLAVGVAMGFMMPDRFLPPGGDRTALALFFATALAVSAMPVIAKILMDLGLTRRNLGVLTLTAAVVDDTIGWILLAVLAGLASEGGLRPLALLQIVALLIGFIALARYVLHPAIRWLLRLLDRSPSVAGADLVLVVVLAFLCAAATEAIGVHAVFGAFTAGCILRQCPSLPAESVRRIESLTIAVFAPIFFASVGLRVDFTHVEGVFWPAAVFLIAVATKVGGCLIGGRLGGLRFVESLALGFGMSARGAMGLIVAVVGLNLGVIGGELFAIIVLMALLTSLLAPLAIRPLVRWLPPTEEEKARETDAESKALSPGRMRFLIPVSGGANALLGCRLAASLCGREGDSAVALYVETDPPAWWNRLRFWRRRFPLDVDKYFDEVRASSGAAGAYFSTRRVHAEGSLADTLLTESRRGFEFLVLGGSRYGHPVQGSVIERVVQSSPSHVVVVRGPTLLPRDVSPFRSILVPTDGSYRSDLALQLAALYAERTGARLTIFYVTEAEERTLLLPGGPEDLKLEGGRRLVEALKGQFADRVKPELVDCRVRTGRNVPQALAQEVFAGSHDLVIMGAEDKSIVERAYFGPNVEGAIELLTCSLFIVIPRRGGR
ncbi:MAG: hypothetical protein A3F84_04440 [Candidatus Handelsmanbacteria bacterium RIFCSPLOWO2_12_FULL_64_10]|uniref:Cation/H+ exchanger domain-containing protein n=1 Tax=Handelsmanbacteria sp. (strain RIFCSPLOWO2_12_FULL_64_10) TaxID=1817868 RepID=A0A1F6C5A3_HANXR|nr:MAG: hypothetical protein A3F84_04440 [Candidatus Handelsmanbacteria bacterium RIFCSPLOWO2_12_FULL_64_10]